MRRIESIAVAAVAVLVVFGAGTSSLSQEVESRFYYAVEDLDSGRALYRGISSGVGVPTGTLLLRAEGEYRFWLFRQESGMVGYRDFATGDAGGPFPIESVRLSLPSGSDRDGDGLTLDVEYVVGTDPEEADSDGDGVPDGDALRLGQDPASGSRTGIVGSVDMESVAVDVCAVDGVLLVANADRGISVFNIFNAMRPLVIAEVDTPGSARAVGCWGSLVAVADGPAGLAIVDLSDPPAASVVRQVALEGNAMAVAAANGLAYVGLSTGKLVCVDLLSGVVLDEWYVENANAVQDVVLSGDVLYVLQQGRLFVVRFGSGGFELVSSVATQGGVNTANGRMRLSVGDGIAYPVHRNGYNTINVRDVSQPAVITTTNTPQFGWKQIALTGSGLGVAAVSPNQAFDGPHNVALYDVSSARVTDRILSEFPTPGIARAVAIYNGLAYVADHAAGLQVVKYLETDREGIAPEITLETNASPEGIVGGAGLRVTALATDDLQIRNVRFFVDDVLVATDGTFPFELHTAVPRFGEAENRVNVRAIATDTGGSTTTASLAVRILPDEVTPKLLRTWPGQGEVVEPLTTLSAAFNEAIDPVSVSNATLRVTGAGPDGRFGTGDDLVREDGLVQATDGSRALALRFPSPLDSGPYRLQVEPGVTDLAGNLSEDTASVFFRVENNTLVRRGALWSFLDDGSDPGSEWKDAGYDDTTWSRGRGELGYGDSDESTVIRFGASPDEKHITAYFRKTFEYREDLGAFFELVVEAVRDDGIAAYLNGVEILRDNLPPGELTSQTLAVTSVNGGAESALVGFRVPANLLRQGENVLAVEVHQQSATSSDLSFDLRMIGVPVDASQRETIVGRGSGWKYLDDGSDVLSGAVPYYQPDFDDVLWPRGAAEFGYGDGDEATVVSFGPDPDNKHITTYFRGAFSVRDPGVYSTLDLDLLRDDGAVVYLNGQEVARSNMPNGRPIEADDTALAVTANANEARFFRHSVATNALRTGRNSIAVDVHQAAADSSDLSFDLELTGWVRSELDLIPFRSTWRYLDDGSDQRSAWRGNRFDDRSWNEGPAQLGFGDGDEATVLNFGGDPTNKFVTTYFRKAFTLTEPYEDSALSVEILRDDGAVVYLNGVEVFRSNMPAGRIGHLTPALSFEVGEEENAIHRFALDPGLLRVGENVIAVEVHQRRQNELGGTSDLSFDLRLYGHNLR